MKTPPLLCFHRAGAGRQRRRLGRWRVGWIPPPPVGPFSFGVRCRVGPSVAGRVSLRPRSCHGDNPLHGPRQRARPSPPSLCPQALGTTSKGRGRRALPVGVFRGPGLDYLAPGSEPMGSEGRATPAPHPSQDASCHRPQPRADHGADFCVGQPRLVNWRPRHALSPERPPSGARLEDELQPGRHSLPPPRAPRHRAGHFLSPGQGRLPHGSRSRRRGEGLGVSAPHSRAGEERSRAARPGPAEARPSALHSTGAAAQGPAQGGRSL